ncbi:hypothetical protein C8J56DRAFT_1025925 [Mycena floridula]|nr:hypothetical protein C8J56DRAFT_1025925 [Mycena floridula]
MAFSSRQLIYNSKHNILPTQTEITEHKAIIVENLEVVDVLRQRIAVIKEEVKHSESVVEQEAKLSLQSSDSKWLAIVGIHRFPAHSLPGSASFQASALVIMRVSSAARLGELISLQIPHRNIPAPEPHFSLYLGIVDKSQPISSEHNIAWVIRIIASSDLARANAAPVTLQRSIEQVRL